MSTNLILLLILPICLFLQVNSASPPSIDPEKWNGKNEAAKGTTAKDSKPETSIPKPKPLTNNTQTIYDEYVNKIADYCLSDQDYEESYGNKSKVGVVKLFFNLLIQEATEQIAINELRRVFQLKPQETNSSGKMDEEFANSKNQTLSKDDLKLFQQKVWQLGENYWAQKMFSGQDINSAEKFLDRKFEVRQIFRLKFDEVLGKSEDKSDKKLLINRLYHALLEVRMDVVQALKKSDWNSSNGDILIGGPKCGQNFKN